jgi:hypothetical protein
LEETAREKSSENERHCQPCRPDRAGLIHQHQTVAARTLAGDGTGGTSPVARRVKWRRRSPGRSRRSHRSR